jgi:hypothetical protein
MVSYPPSNCDQDLLVTPSISLNIAGRCASARFSVMYWMIEKAEKEHVLLTFYFSLVIFSFLIGIHSVLDTASDPSKFTPRPNAVVSELLDSFMLNFTNHLHI